VHHAYLYFANDRLSPAELSAARLDGHLVELGEGYIPADAVETAGLRAASLSRIAGQLLAVTHLSAAWVHGALDEPPARHTVQRAAAHRIHHVIDRRLVYRDGRIPARDLVSIGGVRISSRARTLADLARQSLRDREPAVVEAIDRLCAAPGAAREAIIVLAQQEAVPGKPAALRMLRAVDRAEKATARQEDVTR
jgi:hypothetical protein